MKKLVLAILLFSSPSFAEEICEREGNKTECISEGKDNFLGGHCRRWRTKKVCANGRWIDDRCNSMGCTQKYVCYEWEFVSECLDPEW